MQRIDVEGVAGTPISITGRVASFGYSLNVIRPTLVVNTTLYGRTGSISIGGYAPKVRWPSGSDSSHLTPIKISRGRSLRVRTHRSTNRTMGGNFLGRPFHRAALVV